MKLRHCLLDDLLDGLDCVDPAGDLAGERDGGFHVAAMMLAGGSFSYFDVFSVRSARSAGPGPKRLRNTVEVSSASRIAFFQF
jgi:hypothetical protein